MNKPRAIILTLTMPEPINGSQKIAYAICYMVYAFARVMLLSIFDVQVFFDGPCDASVKIILN